MAFAPARANKFKNDAIEKISRFYNFVVLLQLTVNFSSQHIKLKMIRTMLE